MACARPGRLPKFMDSLLVSALVVAIAEIGDKTQLLAIILATRFKKPAPIILGILVATLANHAGRADYIIYTTRIPPKPPAPARP